MTAGGVKSLQKKSIAGRRSSWGVGFMNILAGGRRGAAQLWARPQDRRRERREWRQRARNRGRAGRGGRVGEMRVGQQHVLSLALPPQSHIVRANPRQRKKRTCARWQQCRRKSPAQAQRMWLQIFPVP